MALRLAARLRIALAALAGLRLPPPVGLALAALALSAVAGTAVANPLVTGVPASAGASGGGGAEAAALADEATALESPEAVREMVARLSDAEVRALLLERLDATAAERAADGSGGDALVDVVEEGARGFVSAIGWAAEVAPNLATGIGAAVMRFSEPRGNAGVLWVFAALGAGLAAGWAAGRLWRAVATALLGDRLALAPDAGLGARTRVFALGAALTSAEVAILLAAAWGVVCLLTLPPEPGIAPSDNLVLWFVLKDIVFNAVVMAALGGLLLAPGDASRRLIYMDDAQARILHRGLVIFATLAGLRAFLLSFLGGHGVNLAEVRLGFWMSLLLYGWMFVLAWRARRGLTSSLIGEIGAPTRAERRLAEAYPYIVMALVFVVWVLTETFTGLGLFNLLDGRLPSTLLIIAFAPAADRVVRALVYRVAPPPEATGGAAAAAFERTRRGYIRIGRVALAGLLLLLLTEIWNFSLAGMAGGGAGARVAASLLEFALVVGVGYVTVQAVAIWIDGLLAREAGPEVDEDEPGGGEGGGAGGSRLATVLPLLSFALQASIVTITVLTALSALGVDTTPLLAGAGIVGIAIGFGAQTLVSDVVSGIFFLIDDAFRTGEYVEVEGTVGTVEKISVRSFRLRHHEGRVHTIPYGQVPKLTNYSRDWVIMKLPFTVPFDTDLERVRKLFKKIGQEMMADERFAEDFLQPFKSQGVLEVNDVGIVIRGKFMAKPGRQWTLRKEIYARVQRAFEEAGIQFARKEVRVKINADPGDLSADERQAVAAAAAEAAERATEAGDAGAKPPAEAPR